MAAARRTTEVHIESWTGAQFAARLDEAMGIYVRAMRYPEHTGAQRAVSAGKHTGLDGFACRVALDSRDRLIGFGYGYTTRPGQWWHDLVRRALVREHTDDWLDDAFELSELHVLPDGQGAGVGRELLTLLAGGIPHRAMLLSTPDSDTRAFRLYRHMGFVDLARNYLFPGDGRPFAVLGARLPLEL
ncbi:GNAT family N-acetyltransferase [Jatrophihabitans endophyticus]|uniref:GNAT family N-acetyltransferase n=1 Tax=Jatrophihabitans endophyticus TaxID=1206085 RepID=UPI0019F4592F|nr:GNAT family N-acetyltransferase [Jatrophihabitans endophyticus]MBE7189749.1 GNAT family N-acetyltransferase [Jatrophihabitans endophyticus]